MNDERARGSEGTLTDSTQRAVSRRHLLAAAAAGIGLAAFPAAVRAQGMPGSFSFPSTPPVTSGSYTPEAITDILNAVVTPHYLAATGATSTLANAAALGLTGWELSMQQAAAAREVYQIDFLTSLGATPLVTAFTFPPGFFSNRAQVLATGEGAATLLVGIHMTAAREFAELGQPMLAKWMYQMGAPIAEQRALFRAVEAIDGLPRAIPPNNKAFATDLFLYTRDIVGVLTALGLVGGKGAPVAYPGRDAVLAAAGPMANAVIQKRPNDASSTITVAGPPSLLGERP